MSKRDLCTEEKDTAAAKTISTVFGEIVWLMSQSDKHKNIQIWELEEMLMLPILARQFRIYYKDRQPIAAVLYCNSDVGLDRSDQNMADEGCVGKNYPGTEESLIVKYVISPFGNEDYYATEACSQVT